MSVSNYSEVIAWKTPKKNKYKEKLRNAVDTKN